MEYAIYPFDEMKITQRHDEGNHKPHWYGSTNYSDKPWDEACKDSGRSYFVPGNDFVIEEILGAGTSITNTVRLRSLNKLKTPYKEELDYLYITITHMEEEDLNKVYVGQVIHKGEKILREGMDGQATGNHLHCTANFGKYYGLLKNSNEKWCYTYEKSLLPDEAFYIDKKKTTVYNAAGYNFKEASVSPTPTPPQPEPYYPFEGVVKKGSPLYREDGSKYPNGASCDRCVTVQGESGSRYRVYGETFNPHIVYVDKCNVSKNGSGYPFPAIIRKGSQLYDVNGNKYNKTNANRSITVQCAVGGRYQIYGDTFNPHVVYCDTDAIIR